ncbi:hypothetical protein WG66_013008 [Moniliophthora roreri]|nr:hypothetical protein WG66_013008 [Moniliophthora roreri]
MTNPLFALSRASQPQDIPEKPHWTQPQ